MTFADAVKLIVIWNVVPCVIAVIVIGVGIGVFWLIDKKSNY